MTTPAHGRAAVRESRLREYLGTISESLRQQPRSFMEAIHPEDREHVSAS